MRTRIVGAEVLLPSGLMAADVLIEESEIAAIGGDARGDIEIDASGKLLAPAFVDIHGDAFERQMMPRPGVMFPLEPALLETDRQLAANGIATAYHAVTLSWESGLRAADQSGKVIDAVETLAPRFTVENRVQLRWETFAEEAIPVIERGLRATLKPSLAFNDHTSMSMRDPSVRVQDRLFEHNPNFAVADPRDPSHLRRAEGQAKRAGLSTEAYVARQLEIWARRPAVPQMIADVAAMARAAGAPMLSHDDTQDETRDFFRAHGAHISEFPMRISVAEKARAAGDGIVFGAPNVVRGGSHIGSPSAADMVEAGLCDALASDYYYPAMLGAVARMHRERRGPLTDLWRCVSAGPARLSGLTDRGEIAVGRRADLVLVDWPGLGALAEDAAPAIRATMSAGRWAYRAF